MNQTIEASGHVLAAGGSSGGSPNYLMIVLLLIVVVMMFVLPGRQRKKMQAQMQQRQEQMVPGTRVMAQSGVFGTVVSVDAARNTMDLEVAPGVVVTMYRPAVTTVLDENGMVPNTPEAQQLAVHQAQQEAGGHQDAPGGAPGEVSREHGTGTAPDNGTASENGTATDLASSQGSSSLSASGSSESAAASARDSAERCPEQEQPEYGLKDTDQAGPDARER